MPSQQSLSTSTSTQLFDFIPNDVRQSELYRSNSLAGICVEINNKFCEPRSSLSHSRLPVGTSTTNAAKSNHKHDRPPSPMSEQIERRLQSQDPRNSGAKASPFLANSSSPSLSLSLNASSLLHATPKTSIDALAAVNLLPLSQCKSHSLSKLAIPSSRQSANMSASNSVTTLFHTERVVSRVEDAHPEDDNLQRQSSSFDGQLDHFKAQSSSASVKANSSVANPASNGWPTRGLPKSNLNICKGPPIEVMEIESKREPPQTAKIIMAVYNQAAGSDNRNGNANIASSSSSQVNKPLVARPSLVRMKSRPKKRPAIKSPTPTQQSSGKKLTGLWHHGRFDTRGTALDTPFTWEEYLKIMPARVAPKEAFRQPETYPLNSFALQMKLEARDPRNSHNWSIASVVGVEGLHIRLRFDGTDAMNDLYELVDSENVRPIGSKPDELLLAPTGFKGNLANYSKFVEKSLKDAIIAGPDCFPATPKMPTKNFFEKGMKLEAVDRKNRDLICPATIGDVSGKNVKIVFDGWLGSFDYTCEYYSRDLFPVNWCRDVGRPVQPPCHWRELIEKSSTLSGSIGQLPPTSSMIRDSMSPEERSTATSDQESSHSGKTSKRLAPAPATLSASRFRRQPKKHTDSEKMNPPLSQKQTTRTDAKNIPDSASKRDLSQHNLTLINLDDSIPASGDAAARAPPTRGHDLSEGEAIEGYQCQRTIPYPECLKGKQVKQMPQSPSLNGRIQNGETINIYDAANHPSSSISETSQMSTSNLLSPDQPEQRPDNHGSEHQQNKKFKAESTQQDHLNKAGDRHPSCWTTDEVLDLIRTEETLIKYSDVFKEHEIDGKAFMLLTTDVLVNHMGLKIGPVLKISDILEQVKRKYDI